MTRNHQKYKEKIIFRCHSFLLLCLSPSPSLSLSYLQFFQFLFLPFKSVTPSELNRHGRSTHMAFTTTMPSWGVIEFGRELHTAREAIRWAADYLLKATAQPDNLCSGSMFTNNQRQEERTGKYGTPRLQYLQELVTEFQSNTSEESKEKIVANLANFAYDPYNYTFLRQLNVLELFVDCLTEPNEKIVEFGVGGICNSCVDPANAAVFTSCGGIPLIIQCLSSPVRNTVNYALGALYYLCNASNKEEILKPEVVDVIKRYAAAGAVSVSFSNLAQALLDKHFYEHK